MRATPFASFVSKTVIVGALCALLWVVRPAGGHGVNEKSPQQEKAVAGKVFAPETTEVAVPRAKVVELPATKTEGTKEQAPYHSVSERPDLAMPSSWKKSDVLMRVGFPM